MRAIAGCALFVLALAGAPALAAPASAQSTTVTAADIQRLQDQVYDLDREISRHAHLRPAACQQLQSELDDLRDEVVYLRVKLRREGTLSRNDYTDVRVAAGRSARPRARHGLAAVRRGQTSTGSRRTPSDTQGAIRAEILDLGPHRGSRAPHDRRERHTRRTGARRPAAGHAQLRPEPGRGSLHGDDGGRSAKWTAACVIPAGSEVRGVISSVHPAGRVDRKGSMTVSFDQITIDNRSYPMRGTVTQAHRERGRER